MKEALHRDRVTHGPGPVGHELNQNMDQRSGDLFAPHDTEPLEHVDPVVTRNAR